MADEPTTLPIAYQQPALRVTATYQTPAGGCPESVDIEVHDGPEITSDFIREVVHALATMPGAWEQVNVSVPTAPAGAAAVMQ